MPPRQPRVASSVPTSDHQTEILEVIRESNRRVLQLLAGQPPLKPRELEILRLTAEGNIYDSTAAKLDTTEQVVKNSLRVIRRKMGAGTTPECIAMAFRCGWLA